MQANVKDGGVAVLVASCDKYRDLWTPFFRLFFRYWQDCPFPVYLGSNDATFEDPRVSAIRAGEDLDWSRSFGAMLAQLPHPYVLLLLEDYLLTQPVDTARIVDLCRVMEETGAACLRLYPFPGPDSEWPGHAGIGVIREGARWRLSLQAALWRKDVLEQLLAPGESAWEFEVAGSARTNAAGRPFLSVGRTEPLPIHYFCTAVWQGAWVRRAVEFCAREGIEVDLRARPVEARRALVRRRLEIFNLKNRPPRPPANASYHA